MRGVSTLFSAVIMTAIALSLAVMVGTWLYSFSQDQSTSVRNNTQTQLECQFANIFIRNATFDCNNDCSTSKVHNISVVVVNSGKISVPVDTIYVQNTTGYSFAFESQGAQLGVGTVVTLFNSSSASCHGINNTIDKIIVSSPACPSTAIDSMDGDEVRFLNC
jgi:hypothetical protein